MSIAWELLSKVRKLKQEEKFVSELTEKNPSVSVALIYPSPYNIAMSSLGYQTIYRLFNLMDDVICERSFLPEDTDLYRKKKSKLFTFESETEVDKFDVLAFSVAYETEILGLIENLELNVHRISLQFTDGSWGICTCRASRTSAIRRIVQ